VEVKSDEIKELLKRELQRYEEELKMERVGIVLEVGDGIARVYGLADAMSSELIEFPGDVMGIVFNLEEDNVGCILLGPDEQPRAYPKQRAPRSGSQGPRGYRAPAGL